jgi:NAD(P)H-nitrite reductase large subunit
MCICLCFDVTKSEIKKSIRDGYDSIEKLSEHIQVGTHCGGCIGRIEDILEKKKTGSFFWPLRTV